MKWLLGIYLAGVPVGMFVNVLLLIGSGGMVTRPSAIVRNGFLWPVMLPVVIGMYLQSQD